jgi:hypothetical protein
MKAALRIDRLGPVKSPDCQVRPLQQAVPSSVDTGLQGVLGTVDLDHPRSGPPGGGDDEVDPASCVVDPEARKGLQRNLWVDETSQTSGKQFPERQLQRFVETDTRIEGQLSVRSDYCRADRINIEVDRWEPLLEQCGLHQRADGWGGASLEELAAHGGPIGDVLVFEGMVEVSSNPGLSVTFPFDLV